MKSFNFTLLSGVLFLLITKCNCARILGIFTPPSYSHFSLGHVLMQELSRRGHEVTYISSFSNNESTKNYKGIVIEELYKSVESFKTELLTSYEKSTYEQFTYIMNNLHFLIDIPLNNSNVQTLLKSDEKFDLVILDAVVNEAFAGFAHRFDCPLIIFSSVSSNIWFNYYVYIPAETSYVPQLFTGYSDQMSFFERMNNMILTSYMKFFLYWYHYSNQNDYLHKYFPGAPELSELIKERVSLVLLNTHPSINIARPLVPNVIEIGGYHVQEPKELPKDLKTYLDKAKQGFILFSLGSNIKSKNIPQEKKQILMKVFEKLPYKVLWKYEDEEIEGRPDNVKIMKWILQNDILPHPNLKLFITHGGLLSTTEAIYHGVPFVGIPIFGDQRMNMANAKSLGIAEVVDFDDLTIDNLMNTIVKVIQNKEYRINIRERSKILRDQPLRPIDNAMFWIEYSLRNKYPKHLQTAAMKLKWYELYNVDVIAFLVILIHLTVFTIIYTIKKWCCSKREQNVKENRKKKQ